MQGFDEAIISLYAKGLTTGEIAAHLAEIYGTQVSRELISKVTDKVVDELAAWQNRPLDRVYPVVFVDAIHRQSGVTTSAPNHPTTSAAARDLREDSSLRSGHSIDARRPVRRIRSRSTNVTVMTRSLRSLRRFQAACVLHALVGIRAAHRRPGRCR